MNITGVGKVRVILNSFASRANGKHPGGKWSTRTSYARKSTRDLVIAPLSPAFLPPRQAKMKAAIVPWCMM